MVRKKSRSWQGKLNAICSQIFFVHKFSDKGEALSNQSLPPHLLLPLSSSCLPSSPPSPHRRRPDLRPATSSVETPPSTMGACCSSAILARGAQNSWGDEEGDEGGEEEEFFEAEDSGTFFGDGGALVRLRGSFAGATMFTQQGWKGVNQDAMTIWQDFAGDKDKIFCGVFDGHGPNGHKVSGYVRDNLPSKMYFKFKSSPSLKIDNCNGALDADGCQTSNAGDDGQEWFSSWKDKITEVFKEIDEQLRSHPNIDCLYSGATAVSFLKEREHLIIANLGDSRAIISTRDAKNQLVPVQLTVDLKPNLPSEAERIRRCGGRIFALREESDVHRIWLPDDDSPGLAMARAFGDFCLKDHGLISIPQIFYRKLSEKDEFIVLATDGIWDVLSNNEVIKIVASAKKRSDAAKKVVERAVRAWRTKHPTSLVDDCAVICVFLKLLPSSNEVIAHNRSFSQLSFSESFKSAASGEDITESEADIPIGGVKEEWNALDRFSRANSMMKLPRSDRNLNE